jgi:hypothetical protein
MLFSWRSVPFKALRRLFLLPGQIISARQGVKPKKRRLCRSRTLERHQSFARHCYRNRWPQWPKAFHSFP